MKRVSLSSGFCFVAVSIGIGSFFAAHVCTKYMQTSFWAGVVLAGVLCMAVLAVIKKYENSAGSGGICAVLKNKAALSLTKALISLFFFVLSVILCAHFSYIIKTWVLSDVNIYFISAGLCFAMFLSLFKGSGSLFKTVAMLCVFAAALIIVLRIVIIFKSDTDKLFPLLEQQRLGVGFLKTTFVMFGIFCSAALCVYVFDKKINPSVWSVGITVGVLMFLLITASCIVLLGAGQTALSYDAMVLAMKRSQVFGRGDILFFGVWAFFMISAFCMVSNAAPAVIKNNDTEEKMPFAANFIDALLVFLLSSFISDKININKILITVLFAGGAGVLCFVALQCFICSLKQGKPEEKHEA